jgi:hypothetical protein
MIYFLKAIPIQSSVGGQINDWLKAKGIRKMSGALV